MDIFRNKYIIWYYVIDTNNRIPFCIKLKAHDVDQAKRKFEKLALRYEKKNNTKYELIKVEVE